MKPLNIAIIVRVFPNIVQTYILSQLVAFKNMGVGLTIIAGKKRTYRPQPPIIIKNNLLDDTVYINTRPGNILKGLISIPLLKTRYRNAVRKILSYDSWGEHEKYYFMKSLVHARALAFRHFDIIHSHSMFTSYHYLFMKEVLSIPMVTTYHGQVPRGVEKLDDSKLKMVLDEGDAFLVNTEFARGELIKLGCQEHKIRIIPQGIILDDFPFSERQVDHGQKIILLTVGRLSIEKGHHVALKAIKELAKVFPTLEYHIVGDGPDKQRLINLVNKYNLNTKVTFHGFKSGNALQQVLSTAHIFVLPSINTGDGYLIETQGVVLQEAQASGIPVIGSRTGGIPDIIKDDDTGLLFNEGDHHALAEKISKLIDNPDYYKRICQAGRHDVETRFDINIVCNQLISVYNEFLNS
jgi:colanic acid/amylovoran biosynthesis glycosyltransferase